jgi:hypothetical protein
MCRILGAALAVGVGVAMVLSILQSLFTTSTGGAYLILLSPLVALVCGYLLRTWWALLAVPVLFLAGAQTIGWSVDNIVAHQRGATLSASVQLGAAASFLTFGATYYVGPLVVGTAIGTGMAKWLARGEQPRQQGMR